MKKQLLFALILMISVGLLGCVQQPVVPDPGADGPSEPTTAPDFAGDQEALAKAFVDTLVAGEFEQAFAYFSPNMLEVIPSSAELSTIWARILRMYGRYESYDSPQHSVPQTGMNTYHFATTFEEGRQLIMVTVAEEQVAGLYFLAGLDVAEEYLADVLNGEYQQVYDQSGAALQSVYVSPEGFQRTWESILATAGQYLSHGSPSGMAQVEYGVFTYPAEFTNGSYDIQINVQENQVVGFIIQPELTNDNNRNAQALAEGPQPSADLPAGVAEQDIMINEGGQYPLHGKLTYPADLTEPMPVAVLVHGSGAHDLDETMYGNTPFKDIAYALAQQGIAVLRYNKAAYAYPLAFADLAEVTIDRETVDDAVAAKQALLEQAEIAISKYYVAGHSLGGMMAPRIAAEGGYDGIIILAGTLRRLVDLSYEQVHYLLPQEDMDEETLAAMLAQYDQMYAEVDEILALPPEELPGKTVMSMPATYIYSISNPPAEQYLREVDLPTLVLQGGKDFQVFAERDYPLYEALIPELTDLTCKLYPELNHLFMQSTMEHPNLEDYNVPAQVDATVTQDIAAWILAHE